jgi:hypothetical protein
MSYDLLFVRVQPNETAEEVATRDRDDQPLGPADPEKDAVKQRMAAALLSLDKGLKRFVFEFAKVAKLRKISFEQARQEFRHVELNDDKTGIQITLFDDEAAITVPYWHDSAVATAVFKRMTAQAAVITRESGLVAYDPQLGKAIDPVADFERMVATYGTMVATMTAHRQQHSRQGKPWWKFW